MKIILSFKICFYLGFIMDIDYIIFELLVVLFVNL